MTLELGDLEEEQNSGAHLDQISQVCLPLMSGITHDVPARVSCPDVCCI